MGDLFSFCIFLGLHPRHMEVPRLGVELELRRIQVTSATYTTAHGNARALTHQARPGIEPVSSVDANRVH